ncbi:MAG: hypothetical protein ACFE0I_12830 [Elainellaceae cyanobacterium]
MMIFDWATYHWRILRLVGYFLLPILIAAGCTWGIPDIPTASSAETQPPIVEADILGEQGLVPLARPGPWQDVTQLIGYGDRLWFANSVTGINHNSADIYSYDPVTQTTRYEQHLFSQDAGTPVVADGLLYWPFEDPRFSADLGEYMVTDGTQWQWRVLPQGQAFHVHVMATHQGMLLAGTGAWAGGLQRSLDGGRTWQVLYNHPTPPRQVSRLTTLASFDNNLYGGFTALHSQDSQLFRWEADTFQPVTAWPNGKRVMDLTPFGGWLYGINRNLDDSLTLWRTDGQQAEPVTALADYRIQALAADDQGLWVLGSRPTGALLWYSPNGTDWTAAYQFEDIQPLDLALFQGQVYVGGRDRNDKGILLGSQLSRSSQSTPPSLARTETRRLPTPSSTSGQTLVSAVRQVEQVLASPATYRDGDSQAALAQALLPLALSQTAQAGDALSQQLQAALPEMTANLFENNVQAPAADVARWYVLWAIGLNGRGYVPVDLLIQPWNTPANDREKYWQTVPAAMWTMAQIGQSDRRTLTLLVERLNNSDDPLWLKGDAVGALSTLTGQSFGYDGIAWQNWLQPEAATNKAVNHTHQCFQT